MINVAQISLIIEQLLKKAEAFDKQFGKSASARFDRSLFKCNSKRLTPCVKESQSLMQEIDSLLKQQSIATDKIDYLTQRLVNQLEAVQRELATHQIRESELASNNIDSIDLKQLYRDLEQHSEWERRLKQIVSSKEQAFQNAPEQFKHQTRKSLIVAEQRLSRCQKAKLAIEAQITQKEGNTND